MKQLAVCGLKQSQYVFRACREDSCMLGVEKASWNPLIQARLFRLPRYFKP